MMSRVSCRPLALSDAFSSAIAASRCGSGHLAEADALTLVEVLIHPLPPLGIVDAEGGAQALIGRQRREERGGRLAHRCGGDAGRLDGEEAGHELAIGSGDALVGLGESLRVRGGRHPGLTRGPRFRRGGCLPAAARRGLRARRLRAQVDGEDDRAGDPGPDERREDSVQALADILADIATTSFSLPWCARGCR